MTQIEARLLNVIPRLAEHRVLVIGDILLDEYLIGTTSRLSREAPIPVVEYTKRHTIPGGAANPAMNIIALGSQVIQIGLIGDDRPGRELLKRLEAANLDTSGVVMDKNRTTSQKTRIVAEGNLLFPQQLARIDRIDRHPPGPDIEEAIKAQIVRAARQVAAIIVSDYHNGMLAPAIVTFIREIASQNNCLLLVDSQGNLDKYSGYDIIRVNHHDTETYFNRPLRTNADFRQATQTLLDRLNTRGVVIGRGSKGVSLQGQQVSYRHFRPTNVTEVYDVTGAGDTSTALLTLGLISGLDLAEAAVLANYAAGLVVQKLGNATPTRSELAAAISRKH